MAHFGHHLLTALPVPLLPMIRHEFALDYTQAGMVVSAFSLAYGLGTLPAGWLADRIGARVLIAAGTCGVALTGCMVGLSPTYSIMIISLIVMGALGGGYHPAAPPLIAASVEPKRQGQALGFHMIGGSASFFLAPLVAAAIATAWSWRGSFIGLAFPALLVGIVVYVLLGRQMVTKKAEPGPASNHNEAPSVPGHLRRLAVFIILSTFTGAIVFSTMSFIPLFFVDHFGVGKETAAALMALIYSCGLWAGPLGGYLSDRWGRMPVMLVVCFISSPVIYLLNLAPYGLGIGALLIAIGVITYIRMPVSEAYIVGQSPEHRRSTILGIYYFIGSEAGGVLTPVAGYLIDRSGFYFTFTIAAVALLAVTLLCSILLWGSWD